MHLISTALLVVLYHSGRSCGQQCTSRQPDPMQCDAYVDCIRGVPTPSLCPDGLFFSPDVPGYPCHYPQEVDCTGRPGTQPAQPTAECPRQFGLFRLGDANNCGQYLNCVHGKGHTFSCPEGLAFNEQTLQCDWPDQVPTCNAEGFLGFSCPVTYSPSLGYPGGNAFYRSPNDCQVFFACVKDRPRLLRCPGGQAFNELTSTCDDPANVTGCYVSDSKYNQNQGGYNQVRLQ